ncbi:putative toxin-like protein [Ranid herpesvirus 3]|uniref:Putative toxin-like protein n=1 Tax=Ranid herpesvirus 3 TaxID=1987509 RepID=A0A1X9T581_9VIRU|nr:putative toxin-like protein [Ranid herpesvirus 3]ARR28860.1 putative toxin-like protein [Ranid herpesvirus 3]
MVKSNPQVMNLSAITMLFRALSLNKTFMISEDLNAIHISCPNLLPSNVGISSWCTGTYSCSLSICSSINIAVGNSDISLLILKVFPRHGVPVTIINGLYATIAAILLSQINNI